MAVSFQRTINIKAVPGVSINSAPNDRIVKLLCSPSIARQTRNFAMGVSIIEGGKIHEVHQHDAEETIYILSGSGEIIINQNEKIKLETGAVILLKPNEPHSLAAYGSEPLQCLWVYAPPGPEKKFKDGANCDVID